MADAITINSDLELPTPLVQTGYMESIQKNLNIFNAGSNGAIVLASGFTPGRIREQAYFKQISSLVTHQDLTSTSAVESKKMEQDAMASIKTDFKIGPVQIALKSFKNAGLQKPQGARDLGIMLGQQVAEYIANAAIASVYGSVVAVGTTAGSTVTRDITTNQNKIITKREMNRTRGLLGDQMSKIKFWLMRSEAALDLEDEGFNMEDYESIGAFTIATGKLPMVAGGAVAYADLDYLKSGDTYRTLGMGAGACMIQQGPTEMFVTKVTGLEQLTLEIQGETELEIFIPGFAWGDSDTTNPTVANLATSTKWTKKAASHKALQSVMLKHLLATD